MGILRYLKKQINIYSFVIFFAALCFISTVLTVFETNTIPIWCIVLSCILCLIDLTLLRFAGYILPIIICPQPAIIGSLILICFFIEASSSRFKEKFKKMSVPEAVFLSLKYYFRFIFEKLEINLRIDPDYISYMSVVLAAAGLFLSLESKSREIALIFFLTAFLMDFLDGYVASIYSNNNWERKLPIRAFAKHFNCVDGLCDRTVEGIMVLYYFLLDGKALCTVILIIGLLINVIYLLGKQKFCTTLIRPLVVLVVVYSTFDQPAVFFAVILLPILIRIMLKFIAVRKIPEPQQL